MNSKLIVDFFIVGAQKAGTTALDAYLTQHPDIFMPTTKELNYFALEEQVPSWAGPGDEIAEKLSAIDHKSYRSYFKKKKDSQISGESSVLYLYSEIAAKNIYNSNPNAKILIVLRNPVERAYSAFQHLRRDNRETISDFDKALKLEKVRIEQNYECLWHYIQVGLYSGQLKHYYNTFPSEQIKIFLQSDFKKEPLKTAKEAYTFLGVKSEFVPDTNFDMNVSGQPKNQSLNDFFNKPNSLKKIIKGIFPQKIGRKIKSAIQKKILENFSPLSSETRKQLIDTFREDILETESLIKRDLSEWLVKK